MVDPDGLAKPGRVDVHELAGSCRRLALRVFTSEKGANLLPRRTHRSNALDRLPARWRQCRDTDEFLHAVRIDFPMRNLWLPGRHQRGSARFASTWSPIVRPGPIRWCWQTGS